jgi:acyl-CoA reductase-like NAD-dependent aldehyde dehydrogenase
MTVTTSAAIASLRHYIDGEWKDGGPELLVSTNPARPHEVVAHGHQASTSDVDQSLIAARAAARSWARTPIHERGAILVRAAEILESSAAAYGLELAREEGKTLAEANGEVFRAAQILRYFGAAGDRAAGELFSSPRRGERILVTHKPLGVVGVVTPFNFPIAIPAWKIAPALVYGNTVVWKPSSLVPLLAVRLTEALVDAGLPVYSTWSWVMAHWVRQSSKAPMSTASRSPVQRRLVARSWLVQPSAGLPSKRRWAERTHRWYSRMQTSI